MCHWMFGCLLHTLCLIPTHELSFSLSKAIILDHNKPIVIPAGQDSLSQIGEGHYNLGIWWEICGFVSVQCCFAMTESALLLEQGHLSPPPPPPPLRSPPHLSVFIRYGYETLFFYFVDFTLCTISVFAVSKTQWSAVSCANINEIESLLLNLSLICWWLTCNQTVNRPKTKFPGSFISRLARAGKWKPGNEVMILPVMISGTPPVSSEDVGKIRSRYKLYSLLSTHRDVTPPPPPPTGLDTEQGGDRGDRGKTQHPLH